MEEFITYEQYGAVGDGKANDFESIRKAHEDANKLQIPVKIIGSPTYYIGKISKPAVIFTDVDWGDATFIIDDTAEDVVRGSVLFEVPGNSKNFYLFQEYEKKGIPDNCLAEYVDGFKKEFIRFGDCANEGSFHKEICLPNEAHPENFSNVTYTQIEDSPLTIHGGKFITIANNSKQEYNYWYRGIRIERSNTIVDGLVHQINNEGLEGAPYAGFIIVNFTYNVILKNLTIQSHKTYYSGAHPGEICGSPMGTYEIQINNSISTRLENIIQTNMDDKSCWGPMITSYCRDMEVINCELGRFDAHAGIKNCLIDGCKFGWQGVKAVGWGTMTIRNTQMNSTCLLTLRYDFGSTWDGDVIIENVDWIINEDDYNYHNIINGINYGEHNFGYPCCGPHNVYIEGLNVYSDKEIIVLGDYNSECFDEQEFVYEPTHKLTLKNINAKSIRATGDPSHFPDLVITKSSDLLLKDEESYPERIIIE